MTRSYRLLAALSALLLLATACTSTSANRAGGPALPLVLKIGTHDQPGRPSADQIEEFAMRVSELSDGSITIEPAWRPAGEGPDWDQRVARMVVDGQLDMGNIPTRSWDTEGVTSLRALNAPFLITTDELVAEVITSDLAPEMMAGLEDIGIVGLALLPEGLRHPFGFNQALTGPEDYDGSVIRTPTSETVRAMFEAFGATTTDNEPNMAEQAAMESSYVLGPAGIATGNVTFYPKVNSLVINAGVWAELTSEQRAILEQAASETRTWAIDTTPTDAEAAAAFCELGQSIVLADASEVAALEAAAAPVYQALEKDEVTRSLIERTRTMKAEVKVTAEAVAECGEPASPTEVAGPATTPIDGVYRFEVTEEELRAGGVAETKIKGLTGVYTFTFDRGEVSFVQTGPYPESAASDAADHFVVDGDQLTIVWPDGKTQVVKWSANTNGDLSLTIVSVPADWLAEDRVYTSKPWIRIGGVPSARLPDGIYRAEIHLEDVLAAGRNNDDGWTGTWTLALHNGTYTMTCVVLDDPSIDCGHSGGPPEVLEAGYVEVNGNRATFRYDADLHSDLTGCTPPCHEISAYWVTWSLEGDTLVFGDVEVGGGIEKVLAPWTRIGDVETTFPEGVYRFQHTRESLVAAGMPANDVQDYAGTWTLTFQGGDLTVDDTVGGRCDGGTYSVDDGRVELVLGPGPACGTSAGQTFFSARWELASAGLRFLELRAPDSQRVLELLFSNPTWVKVG